MAQEEEERTFYQSKYVWHDLCWKHVHPYHILTLQKVQPPDFKKHCNFWTWFKDQLGNNVEEQPIIFFTNEAWFHQSCYVNSHNYWIWFANNPHVFQQTSLQPQKVSAWCVILKYLFIGPIFYKQSVNSEEYQHILANFIASLDSTNEQLLSEVFFDMMRIFGSMVWNAS